MITYFLLLIVVLTAFYLIKDACSRFSAERRIDSFLCVEREICDRIDMLQRKTVFLEMYRKRLEEKLEDICEEMRTCDSKRRFSRLDEKRAKNIFLTVKVDKKISRTIEKQIELVNKRGYE